MKVGIVGAGPAGLTAAYELAKNGISVDVFEASSDVGGMARTLKLWGQRADTGPHRFFSRDVRVNRLWLELVKSDYRMIDRMTRILYGGKFYRYPLSASNAFSNLGPWESAWCVGSYLKTRLKPVPEKDSFESWVIDAFGSHLYELFFKPYSEKLWGIPCCELDADYAAQRIRKLNLFEAMARTVFKDRSKKHKTLVDKFAYPLEGTGMVYRRMSDFIGTHKGTVRLESPVRRVVVKDGRAVGIELENGSHLPYDHVVSTMPLPLLVSRIGDIPQDIKNAAENLKFRNTILIYLNVNSENLFDDQWLYIQSPELKVGRITNYRNWVPELYGGEKSSIISMEYWCNDDDPLWSQGEDVLLELAEKEAVKVIRQAYRFLLRNDRRFFKDRSLTKDFTHRFKCETREIQILNSMVCRIPRCYPVYRKGYKEHVGVLRDYLDPIKGLSAIGRYGTFKYNNQDHSILMGILAAENIALGKRNDLWAVNTDYEDYQEAAVIEETGLVRV